MDESYRPPQVLMSPDLRGGQLDNPSAWYNGGQRPASVVAGPIHLRQRARVSTAMRKEIALYKRSHPDASQKAIAGSFGVCQATVSRILKMKDKWADPGTIASEKYCRYSFSRLFEIEDEMRRWVDRRALAHKLITDKDIRNEATRISEECEITFKASKTWLKNFKLRHGIAMGMVFANGTKHERSAAFGKAGPDPYAASRMAADILSTYPERLEALHDPTYVPPDISRLCTEVVVHDVVDLAELSAMISRTPTPEPDAYVTALGNSERCGEGANVGDGEQKPAAEEHQ